MPEPKETKEKPSGKNEGEHLDVSEMMKAGVHLGHRTTKVHPKMAEYILGVRNTSHIIDLAKTVQCLRKALDFIRTLSKEGGIMLFVGTKPPLRKLVQDIAKECSLPYVVERWLGGTFTNFKVISQRTAYFKELEEKKEKGELEKYTKKERIKIGRELDNLKKKFEGLKSLEKVPEAVFICDIRKDRTALREANRKGIKVVAIVDTNVDPTNVDYPIPANDDAISAVRYILGKVKDVIFKSVTLREPQD